jgi:hypothetical protein
MSCIGYIDSVNRTKIIGWAMKLGSIDKISVRLIINGDVVSEQVCDQFREDLRILKIHPSGNCGFCFDLPFKSISHSDHIRVIVCDEPKTELFHSSMNNDLVEYFNVVPKPLLCSKKCLGLIWSAKSGCTYAVKWYFYQLGLWNLLCPMIHGSINLGRMYSINLRITSMQRNLSIQEE